MVAHACNPRYLGGRDQEDQGSRPLWALNKLEMVAQTCDPRYMEDRGRGTWSQSIHGQKIRPYPKHN
jgi:hypothetical protein